MMREMKDILRDRDGKIRVGSVEATQRYIYARFRRRPSVVRKTIHRRIYEATELGWMCLRRQTICDAIGNFFSQRIASRVRCN